MTPLLVATGGHIPCLSPLKIATAGFIGSCDAVEPPVSSGGGSIVGRERPKYYSKIISYESESKEFKVEIPPIPVEESSLSYDKEIDRFQTAALSLGFQMQAVQEQLEMYAELLEEYRYRLLLQDIRNTDLFIQDLLKQIEMLRLIRKKRADEEVILALILADEL